ncbi:MAG: hypothetical protein Q9160_005237 [Pyrenula sp. 1 TL-2023]
MFYFKSLALYSLLLLHRDVSSRAVPYDSDVSRREEITGSIRPHHVLDKRVDVPVVAGAGGGKPVPVVAGEGAPKGPGSGDPAASPGDKPPPVGAPGPADNPGSTGGQKPPPVGSGQDPGTAGDSGSTGAKKPPPVGSNQSPDPADKPGSDGGQKSPPIGSPQWSEAGSEPGISQADVTFKDMITASEKPIDAQNKAIADKANDAPTMDWSGKYKANINEPGKLRDLAYRPSFFEYFKLKESSRFQDIRIISRETTDPPPPENKPVHEALYGKDDKVIIAKQSWRDSDAYSNAERLKWYQITFKNWRDLAGRDAGKLKWIIRDTISNTETRTVISKALSKANIDPDRPFSKKQVAVFEPSDESFKALAGTDNGRGVFYMLGRYHNEMGNLKVVKIHVWADDGPYFMALELGH